MSNIPITWSKKRWILIISAFVIGVILIIFGSSFSGDKDATTVKDTENEEIHYSEYMEDRIEEFLKTVNGIESARVFVTIDGGNEYEYAQKGNSDGFASDYLIIDTNNGEEAAVVRQIYPKIRGVGVSCTNGDNAVVKEEITSLLSAALGISANKINVTGYNGQS